MKRILTMLALSALMVGCAGRTAMYDAPDKDDKVAVIGVSNEIKSDASGSQSGGWQAPGSGQGARVGVFKVDGERTNEMGGKDTARLRGGEHTIQVFADQGGALRFGDVTYEFKAGNTYVIRIYTNKSESTDYRAELVNRASPEQVLEEVQF